MRNVVHFPEGKLPPFLWLMAHHRYQCINIAAFPVTVVYMHAIAFSAGKRKDLQVSGRTLLKTNALGWDD